MRCAGSDLDQDPMTFARHESSLAEMGQMAEGQEKQSMSRINTSYCTFDDAFIKMFFFFLNHHSIGRAPFFHQVEWFTQSELE